MKPLDKMVIFLSFLFLLVSSAAACDRCVHRSKAAYFLPESPLSSGACGYGSMALEFNRGHGAAVVPSLYKDGAGCGACYKIRCKDPQLCDKKGTTVIVTDLNKNNHSDFVLSSKAFMAMANRGSGENLFKLGLVDVEYKRVPCQFKNKNMALRVEESSKKPNYLAVKLLYQGGQTDVLGMDVAPVGNYDWNYMTRKYGAVWETQTVPKGALDFRFVVTSGFDGARYFAKNVLPADWKAGVVYDTGIQIHDIAQEGCFPCDDGSF